MNTVQDTGVWVIINPSAGPIIMAAHKLYCQILFTKCLAYCGVHYTLCMTTILHYLYNAYIKYA